MKNITQEEKFKTMTEAPIPSLIGKLAIPTMISMLVTSFYNMADTFFVGKLGVSETGAVGVAFSVMAIIQAVGFFFGHGSGNYISRALGAHEFDNASTMAATGFFSAVIGGTVIMIAGLLFLEPLAVALGSTDTILPYAKDYLRWILIGAPYMTPSLVLNNQLRFQGNAVYAMIGLVSGAVLNIGLDPLLIFVFHMGVSGAAIATIFSQFVGFVILYIGVCRSNAIDIRFKNFKPSLKRYGIILNGGTPSLFRQGLNSVATICLNVAARGYGDFAIAGMSVVTRIMQFANSCLIGFGQGLQPVCGFNYGAKRYDRVREGFWFCVKVSTAVLVGLAVILFAFAPGVVALFTNDADVIAVGRVALRWQCITFPLAGWVVMSNMMTQTIGKAVPASFLAAARQGLFFIPAVLFLQRFFGILGVEISQAVADVITFVVAVPLVLKILNEMKETEKRRGLNL